MKTLLTIASAIVLVTSVALLAHGEPSTPKSAPDVVVPTNEMHPAFFLLNGDGKKVLKTQDADVTRTCGECHDTAFILSHSSHHKKLVKVNCVSCHLPGAQEAFDGFELDEAARVHIPMAPPSSMNCGQCHGVVDPFGKAFELGADFLVGDEHGTHGTTLRTGEVFSPQAISSSFLNIANKGQLSRSWDIHAARGLHCSDCHFASNNPSKSHIVKGKQAHLKDDPRSLSISEYLKRPDHMFRAPQCADCHDPMEAHQKLPFAERHIEALACQTCHVPNLKAPALRSADHTVVTENGGPRMEFRGVDDVEGNNPNTWFVNGYRPFLGREEKDGRSYFVPYNLVSRWDWVVGPEGNPVDDALLLAAWKQKDGTYHPEILSALDANEDGALSDDELVLDTDAKTEFIRQRLVALGAENPRIAGDIDVHPVRHGVTHGVWVASDCDSCHARNSRFNEPIALGAGPFPGGVLPQLSGETASLLDHRSLDVVDGRLQVSGDGDSKDTYVLGHTRRSWSDTVGFSLFLLVFLALLGHGVLRYLGLRKRNHAHHSVPMKRVYMYGAYERVWHWTMAASIVLLLITGFQIHYPDTFDLIDFRAAVWVHNLMAVIMILNAVLSLFYHVTTGEIRQFVPERSGLLRRVVAQALYYGKGIFLGAAHPTAKSPEKKLNPLQQLTYVGLLNILFPLQIATGILLWVGGQSPEILDPIGGMALVAPVHNLGSWLFMTFLVVHVYLTTTGHTVFASIQAMINGWEEVEIVDAAPGDLPDNQGVKS